jgi:hypothetical protein
MQAVTAGALAKELKNGDRPVFSRWTVRGEWKDVVMRREERKMNGA